MVARTFPLRLTPDQDITWPAAMREVPWDFVAEAAQVDVLFGGAGLDMEAAYKCGGLSWAELANLVQMKPLDTQRDELNAINALYVALLDWATRLR